MIENEDCVVHVIDDDAAFRATAAATVITGMPRRNARREADSLDSLRFRDP